MESSLGLVSPWDQRPRYSQPTAANLSKPEFWRERRKTYSEESQVVVMWLKAAVGNAYETRYERIRESGEWPANRLNVAKGQFAYLNFRLFFFFFCEIEQWLVTLCWVILISLWFLFIQDKRRELLRDHVGELQKPLPVSQFCHKLFECRGICKQIMQPFILPT